MSAKDATAKKKRYRSSQPESLLKVSQVSKATGISTSAINYYVRVGLLPPPIKTHKNMAYYDPSYVQMVNYIKRLQLQKHLPLDQIKEIMNKKVRIWGEMGNKGTGQDDDLHEGQAAQAGHASASSQRILEAGSYLFTSRGYFATNEEDIIKRARVSMGEFYELYSGKEDLLLAMAEEGVKLFRDRVSVEIASMPDMLERIRTAIPVAFQIILENREIYTLFLEGSVLADVSYDRSLVQLTASIAIDLKATIARGVKEGTIRRVNPDITAHAIIGQLVRLTNYWVEDPMKHDIEEITRESVDFVTRALRP
jgi:AcrR family transcriptional regulator/predicted DNA-binding transcriptional regulator AlpA